VRTLAGHLQDWGGRPLLCEFDRPKTMALKCKKNREVTEWNPVFAEATLETGIGVELCWPYQVLKYYEREAAMGSRSHILRMPGICPGKFPIDLCG
jgi:hypothetical protein